MRLLVWTQYFWPERFVINDLVASLRREHVDVTILTGKPNYPDGLIFPGYRASSVQYEHYGDCDILRLPIFPRGRNSLPRLALNYLSFVISGLLLGPIVLRRRRFDAIFVYAPSPLIQALPAILVARLKGAPLIVWVQDLWPEAIQFMGSVKNPLVLGVISVIVRFIYWASDSVLIQSESFRPSVERLVSNKDKIHYFPNAVEDTSIKEGGYHSDLEADLRACFSVVFAGNLGKAQSCETILHAAERLRDVADIRLFLVGDGSRLDYIRDFVRERQLQNVITTGARPQSHMAAVFAASSALLVTLANDKGLASTIPSKLQSYLCAGKPIVACMNGEGARIVKEANAGLCCTAEDGDALASAILSLYRMEPVDRTTLGDNGRRYFLTHFELTSCTRELVAHLESLRNEGAAR